MTKVRTWVGLDVHAAKVVACVVDAESGELSVQRLSGDTSEVVSFCAGLAGPTRVAYEAGPTGFGLARALVAAGVECVVAAPGKIEPPAQDKVKTDRRFAAQQHRERGLGKPETFRFLGFTHICSKNRKGRFQLKRITDAKRSRAKLRGHANYYGVPTNHRALYAFRSEVVRYWLMALRRRSQRTRLTWARMRRLRERWLPFLQIAHPWPDARFDAGTQGRSPVR